MVLAPMFSIKRLTSTGVPAAYEGDTVSMLFSERSGKLWSEMSNHAVPGVKSLADAWMVMARLPSSVWFDKALNVVVALELPAGMVSVPARLTSAASVESCTTRGWALFVVFLLTVITAPSSSPSRMVDLLEDTNKVGPSSSRMVMSCSTWVCLLPMAVQLQLVM